MKTWSFTSGWRNTRAMRVRYVLVSLALATVAPAAASEEQAPTMELLEFVGSFEQADGGWFDPLLLDDDSSGSESGSAEGQASD